MGEALHLLKRSQAVGESGIEALNGEGEGGVQELENNIVGADATIKAWRFMQVTMLLLDSVMPFTCHLTPCLAAHTSFCFRAGASSCLQLSPTWVSPYGWIVSNLIWLDVRRGAVSIMFQVC